MKSKYFTSRSQHSQLRGTREKAKPKQTNWDRIVYMVFLMLFLLFIGYYLASRSLYVTGDGRVVTEEMLIRAPVDIRIEEHYLSPDSPVSEGDALFKFTFLTWQQERDARQDASDQIERINLEIDAINDKIVLKEEEADVAKSRIAYLEDLQQNFKERVRLDVATSLELTEVDQNLFNANAQLQLLQTEITVLINSRNRHIIRRDAIGKQLQQSPDGTESEVFVSPASGTIQHIQIRKSQHAFRTEEILSLKLSDADIYILSLFRRKDAKHLANGTVMTIRFDNGEESTGIIRRTYDPRENLINPVNPAAELYNKTIAVELVPADNRTRAQWLQMDRSGAEVYKSLWSRPRFSNIFRNRDAAEPEPNTRE